MGYDGLNIAICDDEPALREQLEYLIKRQGANCRTQSYGTGEALLASGERFDIVFLDIRMDGMSGIDTAKALRERNEDCVIIFVTGIKEYVFDAFDVAAFHYLLKPMEERKFAEVFHRARTEAEKLKSRVREPFVIRTRNRSFTLRKDSVRYVENRGKKVEIHTGEEVIAIYAAMQELEERLGEGFYRCHRGYLVNMAYIAEYDGSSITLGGGEKLYLAKDKYREFVKTYMRYLKNGGVTYV